MTKVSGFNYLTDNRTKFKKRLPVYVALIWLLIGFTILIISLFKSPKLLNPKSGIVASPQPVEAMEPKEVLWNDEIRRLFPHDEAGRMIRICLREVRGWKGDPKYALNDKNTNGSWDYGWCQVNSCHKPKSMTNEEWKDYLENPTNHAKEVRRIYLSQGFGAWTVSRYTK